MGVTADPTLSIHPLDIADYERMVEVGILGEGDAIELIDGVILEMSPQGNAHNELIQWLLQRLVRGLPERGHAVRPAMPLRLAPRSMPEPDLMVVPPLGPERRGHPTTGPLVIEVSNTSRRFDLGAKAALYAAHGLPEYWVVDVRARTVHVHTDPAPGGYRSIVLVSAGSLTAAFSGAPTIDVDAMFAILDELDAATEA